MIKNICLVKTDNPRKKGTAQQGQKRAARPYRRTSNVKNHGANLQRNPIKIEGVRSKIVS